MNITLLLVWPFCVFFFFLQSAGLRFLPFVYASLTSGCLILERVDDLDGNSCLRLHPTSTTLGFGWNTTAAAAVEVSWHFQGAVPGWDPVSIRQFSRWRLLNPHFLPSSPLLSSLCLSALKTWLGPFCKHSCLFLFSKPCIVFDYRCLKIFFLLNCCHGSVVFFFSLPLCRHRRALFLSNKMSPHKMSKCQNLDVYQTSYQVNEGNNKKYSVCVVLSVMQRLLPSLFPFLRNTLSI